MERPTKQLPSLDTHDAAPVDDRGDISRSQRKREALAIQALGAQLAGLSVARLVQLDLPEALYEAVVAVQNMRQRGARTRQMHYIGRLMRQLEPDVLRTVYAALTPGRARRAPWDH